MKSVKVLSAGILLTGFFGVETVTLWAQHGVVYKAPASQGSYCHLKFPAIREETLYWERPVLKDASSGDIIDFYGPCDYDPHGKDAIQTQMGIWHHSGRSFRCIPAGCFARFRPPISEHSGHPGVGVKSMS